LRWGLFRQPLAGSVGVPWSPSGDLRGVWAFPDSGTRESKLQPGRVLRTIRGWFCAAGSRKLGGLVAVSGLK